MNSTPLTLANRSSAGCCRAVYHSSLFSSPKKCARGVSREPGEEGTVTAPDLWFKHREGASGGLSTAETGPSCMPMRPPAVKLVFTGVLVSRVAVPALVLQTPDRTCRIYRGSQRVAIRQSAKASQRRGGRRRATGYGRNGDQTAALVPDANVVGGTGRCAATGFQYEASIVDRRAGEGEGRSLRRAEGIAGSRPVAVATEQVSRNVAGNADTDRVPIRAKTQGIRAVEVVEHGQRGDRRSATASAGAAARGAGGGASCAPMS